jgi:tetratricopeptide (TPR) repeat protein
MKTENVRLQRILEMLKSSPEDSFLLFAAAQEYTKQQDFENAPKFYTELLLLYPNYTGAYLHSGKLHELTKNESLAIAEYKKGIEICKKMNASHDLNELQAALINLE